MKTEHGKYIPLSWEGDAEDFCVRGHLTDDEAEAEFVRYHENELGIDEPPAHGPWRHAYARWSMRSTWDGNGHIMETYDEPSPKGGRFKITIAKAGGGQ